MRFKNSPQNWLYNINPILNINACTHVNADKRWKDEYIQMDCAVSMGKNEVKSECAIHSVVSDCNPMDCSPTGFSVHEILQASIQGWRPIPFSRGSLWSQDPTQVSCTADGFFTVWGMREAYLCVCCFLSRCPGEKCLENYFSTPSILKNTLSFLLVTIYVKNKPPRSRAIEKFHLWFVPEQQRPAGFAAEGKVEPRRRVRGTWARAGRRRAFAAWAALFGALSRWARPASPSDKATEK